MHMPQTRALLVHSLRLVLVFFPHTWFQNSAEKHDCFVPWHSLPVCDPNLFIALGRQNSYTNGGEHWNMNTLFWFLTNTLLFVPKCLLLRIKHFMYCISKATSFTPLPVFFTKTDSITPFCVWRIHLVLTITQLWIWVWLVDLFTKRLRVLCLSFCLSHNPPTPEPYTHTYLSPFWKEPFRTLTSYSIECKVNLVKRIWSQQVKTKQRSHSVEKAEWGLEKNARRFKEGMIDMVTAGHSPWLETLRYIRNEKV